MQMILLFWEFISMILKFCFFFLRFWKLFKKHIGISQLRFRSRLKEDC